MSSEAGGPHVGCDLSVEVMAGLCLKYGWGFWVHVLLVRLTPPGVTPELFQLILHVRFCLRQSKITVAA